MSNMPSRAVRNAQIGNGQQIRRANGDLPGWIGWVAGLLVASIVLAAAVLSAGSWGIDAQATPVSISVAPEIGGMEVTNAGVNAMMSSTLSSTAGEMNAVYRPGSRVVSRRPDMPMYADASMDSLLLHSYGSGSTFTVLEPSGDYSAYPVPNDGTEWIRVRAADGLVGWTPVDAVVAYP